MLKAKEFGSPPGPPSEFDKQLFFMTALIAFERAPIGAESHWLDAGHHHSSSAILAPGAPFDDLQRTRNKLGLGHGLLLFQAGALPGSQPPNAWHRAEPVMRYVQHLFLEGLVKMDRANPVDNQVM
jgi:hypothetical protein